MVMRSIRVVVAALFVAAVMSFAPVMAADASAAVGYVDVPIVFEQYSKTAKSKTDLEAFAKSLDLQLQTLDSHRMLDENEAKELVTLITKPSPTEKDKERIKALQDKEKALDVELKGLQSKSEPTEQEKARQKELMDRAAKSEENLRKISQSSEAEFAAKRDNMTAEIRNDILKAINDVAKQKNIGVVVDKMAILYGGTDLTQPVLDKLNGKK